MPRTTFGEVSAIVDVDDGDDLTPFIGAANDLVTEVCAKPAYGYSVSRLARIECWLAAHFYCVWKPREKMEGAGKVQAVYQSTLDIGFNLTHYGQQVLRLDTAGGLAALDNSLKKVTTQLPVRRKGSVTFVGGRPRGCIPEGPPCGS